MSPGRRTLPHAVVQASKLAPTHSEADLRRLPSPRRRTLPCVAATLVARHRTWLGTPIFAALGAVGALAAGCMLPEVSLPSRFPEDRGAAQRRTETLAAAATLPHAALAGSPPSVASRSGPTDFPKTAQRRTDRGSKPFPTWPVPSFALQSVARKHRPRE